MVDRLPEPVVVFPMLASCILTITPSEVARASTSIMSTPASMAYLTASTELPGIPFWIPFKVLLRCAQVHIFKLVFSDNCFKSAFRSLPLGSLEPSSGSSESSGLIGCSFFISSSDELQPEQIISPANKIARDRNNIFLIMNRLFRELFQISSLLLIK